MNLTPDRKAAMIHDAIQAAGLLVAALPQSFVTTGWGHFLVAIPGALGVAFGQYLSWSYNGPTPISPSSLNAPNSNS